MRSAVRKKGVCKYESVCVCGFEKVVSRNRRPVRKDECQSLAPLLH